MTGIVKVGKGSIIHLDEPGNFVVLRFETPTKVVVRSLDTQVERTVSLDEIRFAKSDKSRLRPDLGSISDDRIAAAQQKYEAIKLMVDKHATTVSEIEAAALKAGVAVSTIYRWLKEYREGTLLSSLVRKERIDTGKTRLSPTTELIMSKVIAEYWMTSEKRSYALTYRELKLRCRQQNIRPPSLPTLVARASRLDPKESTLRRLGRPAADALELVKGTVPNADRPYSVIQIDHTMVDIQLVDSIHRVAIGRPWITVAIDVDSRMIVGYYISFDTPGTLGTGICIANAMLSKQSMLANLGLDFDYPCRGKPRVVHLDNAKEFHGKTLDHACLEYGIDLQFRKLKVPRYGGHIERLMGTLATEIHAVPGTTFSNSGEKGDYDSAEKAVMTLKEFELWLANLIIGLYHNREHSALNSMSPLQKYKTSLVGDDSKPSRGVIEVVTDEQTLRLDFLPMFEGTIQTYGVKIDHVTYSADVLRRWVGATDPKAPTKKRKFIFRRDPRDISYIYFFDPDAKTYFKIPYRNMSHPAISLWEMRAVRKFLKQQGRDSVDEESLFRAFEAMRAIEQKAVSTTGKVRRSDAMKRAIRRKESPQPLEMKTSKVTEIPLPEKPPTSQSGTDFDGFDEVERY
jgi:putative transposase